MLVDYVDFVVHVFSEKARKFYDLERLWKTAKRLAPSELTAKPRAKKTASKTKTKTKVKVKTKAKAALRKLTAAAPRRKKS